MEGVFDPVLAFPERGTELRSAAAPASLVISASSDHPNSLLSGPTQPPFASLLLSPELWFPLDDLQSLHVPEGSHTSPTPPENPSDCPFHPAPSPTPVLEFTTARFATSPTCDDSHVFCSSDAARTRHPLTKRRSTSPRRSKTSNPLLR